MLNSTVDALDQAISRLRAEMDSWEPLPSLATVRTDQLVLSVDRHARLVSIEFEQAAVQSGLTALGDQIMSAQHRALDAFASGQGNEDVELSGEEPTGQPLPRVPGAPQLPPFPTQAELDHVAAALEERFTRRNRPPSGAGTPSAKAHTDLVTVEMDVSGQLTRVQFAHQAGRVTREELADALISAAAQARTTTH